MATTNRRWVGIALLLLASCADIKAPPPPPNARIVSFTADKRHITAGEPVTLTFRTEHATEVQVLDDEGHFVELLGEAAQGTATVTPTRTTFYVARANGLGGRDAAFIQVSVDEAARDVFLVAVPDEIDPGATAQLLWGATDATTLALQTGDENPTPLSGTEGTVLVTPARSERYTLHVNGVATSSAEVHVRPRLNTARLEAPDGLDPGDALTVRWSTRGAQRVVVRELTFGTLIDTTTMLDDGFVTWAVPTTTAPLRFEVTASSNAGAVTKHLVALVGDAPRIERVTAPPAASVGRPFTIAWNTLGAMKLAVEVDGHAVFETSQPARVEAGAVSLPAPGGPTDYTVVATNNRNVSARHTITVRTVPFPTINTFTLTPPTLNSPGEVVTANWSTTNARRIQLRLAHGPTVAVNETTPNNGSTTFRAGAAQTYELEAWNEAGDRAVATATLGSNAAAPVTLSPTPTLVAEPTELRWNLASLGVTEVVGLPTPRPAPIDASPNFVDLSLDASAFEFIFADRADGSAALPLPDGFHFMLLGVERPTLWVSVNGFITFEPPQVSSTNLTLNTDAVPTMLAPYWDDLTLGPNSKVLAGFAPRTQQGERRFVIQWHRVFADATELTFQAQLTETGQVTFIYETLGALHGDSATIGVKEATQAVIQQVATVNEHRELGFFTGAPANGALSFIAQGSGRLSLVGRTGAGVLPFQVQLVALKSGDLTITEAMPSPALPVAGSGQWVELHNNTTSPIALDELVLRSTGSSADGGATFGHVTIPANGYLVAGQSANPADNDDAGVTVVVLDVPLQGGVDAVSLWLGHTVLDTLPWSATSNGVSVQRASGVLLGADQPVQTPLCTRATRTFGAHGAIGTPGLANEACAPYRVERIAGAYVTLGGPGDVELLSSANDYTGFGAVPLTVPFTYFGQSFNSLGLSMAGFFTFGNPLTRAHEAVNDALPNTTQPNGVVAPFWDRLVRNPMGHLWLRRASDRTIVSWQDFRVFGANLSSGSKVFFQVHLFDSGVIEFHYGTFDTSAPTYAGRARGASATVWLEHPDGGVAVPVGVNVEGTIQENSGVRFVP